ncbi:aspartate ammonia-lyase [Pseudoalteromonas sp. SSM20]|uniref:aspartate ammonia-lyase n=1 Tax=Pseudoalteromonas sp. SSM20 TaxID=3139394 RepID=UPI003BA881A5
MRIEKDLLGTMTIENDVFYGIQTQRAIVNFPLSTKFLSHYPSIIKSLAYVKAACARANNQLGLLNNEKTNAICASCSDLINDQYHEYFPVGMIQGGAGTSSNMNANEVIANLALKKLGYKLGDYQHIHPNTDVNMSQSTNDVYPTAIRLSVLLEQPKLLLALESLINSFTAKGNEFSSILKLARTQLQDAVPMTLGQEFHGFASTLKEDVKLIKQLGSLLNSVNLGGTAVGTGINTHKDYAELAIKELANLTDIPFEKAEDLIEASSDMGDFVIYSSALKRLALKLSKIANDLRLLSMGPRAGISEINLPAKQPGSSIMPGKVNPVIPEAVSQVAYQVVGLDCAISMAAEAGQLQLNAMEPLIALNLMDAISLLTNACDMFEQHCVSGITANQQRCKDLLDNSLALVTALNPFIGYEAATKIAKDALLSGASVKELVIQQGILNELELSNILKPEKLTQPV